MWEATENIQTIEREIFPHAETSIVKLPFLTWFTDKIRQLCMYLMMCTHTQFIFQIYDVKIKHETFQQYPMWIERDRDGGEFEF